MQTLNSEDDGIWVFGYGSLIWRPDFTYRRSQPATLAGWKRRFWQGSHDHRGLPHAPGRVVTLVEDAAEDCDGMAYEVDSAVVKKVFENLDHREKNGYQRFDVLLTMLNLPETEQQQTGVVYIAPIDNFAYLGEADVQHIAQQIVASRGPSGRNRDYLFELADALRELEFEDDHVFEIERAVRAIIAESR